MLNLLILLALLAAGFFAYPLASESASTACDALESRMLREVAASDAPPWAKLFGEAMHSGSRGAVSRLLAISDYPQLPPGIACSLVYWRITLDRDWLSKQAPRSP